MTKSHIYRITEYGTISIGNSFTIDYNKIEIIEPHFNELVKFIEENQITTEIDRAFVIFRKNGQRYIKVQNFVGVIETKQGLKLEILPKTYKSDFEDFNYNFAKKILLKMLKSLKNSPFIALGNAHLDTKNEFPLLEIFIFNFLSELSKLTSKDIKGDYNLIENNNNYFKGKLLIGEHIKFNSFNKTKFYCSFDEFNYNIAPNKLLKSTLLKLFTITNNSYNKKNILQGLTYFENLDKSKNIDSDLELSKFKYKNYLNYELLISWSEIYLKNKSIINFAGSTLNQAILFPMEKLFESYITYLFKKYIPNGIVINTQDKKYFLINQKKDILDNQYQVKKFPLKPDIVLNNNNNENLISQIIIDTKWKVLNDKKNKFDIKESDIYQMHAYGSKYKENSIITPRLCFIYPYNINFKTPLLQMKYSNDLYLDVIPFNFYKDEKEQIEQIYNILIS